MAASDDTANSIGPGQVGAFTEKGAAKSIPSGLAEGLPPYSFPAGSSENARLRLIRATWGGLLVSFRVELDGFFVSELAHGATLDVNLSAGEHHLAVWGGGAFFGASERFVVEEFETATYKVGYSWLGGVKLSRV